MILCSETFDPMGNRFFSCRSIFLTSSWSVLDVNPSAPEREPERAASRVDTWKSRRASSTWLSRANGERDILARDSEIRTMASNCLQGV